jgi:hypothetical protein
MEESEVPQESQGNGGVTRRDFVKGLGLLPLAAALPTGALTEALADTSTTYRFLTAHQAAVVTEATARLIPGPDDDPTEIGHPGAREANVVRYIDIMLAAFTFATPRIHADGPFSDRAGASRNDMQRFLRLPRMRRLAWRKRIKQLHQAYRDGVKELDGLAGGDFTQVSTQEQDSALTQSSFRSLLFEHAIEGMYAVPEYGGNQGLVGWQEVKFPGDSQPRGYTDQQVSQSDGPDPTTAAEARLVVDHYAEAVRRARLGRHRGR